MTTLTVLAGLSLAFSLPSNSPLDGHWADVDGDGRRDVVLIGPDGALHLILNDELRGMQPAPDSWGLTGFGGLDQVALGDADQDGDVDLFLVGRFGEHRLLLNQGKAFEDATRASGLTNAGDLQGASWVDYDQDGDLDLSLTPAGGGLTLYRNLGDSTFEPNLILSAGTAPEGGVRTSGTDELRAATVPGAVGDPSAGAAGSNPSTRAQAGGRRATGQDLDLTVTTFVANPAAASLNILSNCVTSVNDIAGGPCVMASSDPLDGTLLPLGPEFFVSPAGDVGLRNQNPQGDLHISGGDQATIRLTNTNGTGASSTLQLAHGDDYDLGMELKSTEEGLEVNSRRLGPGGIPNTYGPHLFIDRGFSALVGIGEPNPNATLHVNGTMKVDGTIAGRRVDNTQTFLVEPSYGGVNGSARVRLDQGDGNLGIVLDAENSVNSGSKITMYGDGGTLRVELDADDGGAAFMRLYKANNTVGINMDADQNGDARITTEVLEITGGADLVESFDTGDIVCEPGTVLAIDPDRPGELTLSSGRYDRRVAGIVSGAGGVQPGLHMGQTGVASGSTPVALTGRVYVRCSAENGAVQPGDLLTTSSIPGVAMRASDPMRSFGSSIGKAMSNLEEGTGLVLVLVNLQ